MPSRSLPLSNGNFYHIYNKGSKGRQIFFNDKDYQHCLNLLEYYQYLPNISYSVFLQLPSQLRIITWAKIIDQSKQISIHAYCLMGNHYHLILRQETSNAISLFQRNWQSGYAQYINKKLEDDGSLFEGRFKATHIQTPSQLNHVGRYIHLNPYSSYITKNNKGLIDYPWSSLKSYIGLASASIPSMDETILKSTFDANDFNSNTYLKFILDQADYQRSLELIKHLMID